MNNPTQPAENGKKSGGNKRAKLNAHETSKARTVS